jgi:hypothetical protein
LNQSWDGHDIVVDERFALTTTADSFTAATACTARARQLLLLLKTYQEVDKAIVISINIINLNTSVSSGCCIFLSQVTICYRFRICCCCLVTNITSTF